MGEDLPYNIKRVKSFGRILIIFGVVVIIGLVYMRLNVSLRLLTSFIILSIQYSALLFILEARTIVRYLKTWKSIKRILKVIIISLLTYPFIKNVYLLGIDMEILLSLIILYLLSVSMFIGGHALYRFGIKFTSMSFKIGSILFCLVSIMVGIWSTNKLLEKKVIDVTLVQPIEIIFLTASISLILLGIGLMNDEISFEIAKIKYLKIEE